MKKETKKIWKDLLGNLLFQMFAIVLGSVGVYEISRRFAGIGMDIWISTGSAIAVTIGMLGLIAVIIVYHAKYYWELQKRNEKKLGARKIEENEHSEDKLVAEAKNRAIVVLEKIKIETDESAEKGAMQDEPNASWHYASAKDTKRKIDLFIKALHDVSWESISSRTMDTVVKAIFQVR